jgi:predicted permease
METLWQDIKYGARMLVKNPTLTLIVALTLGLGIGANTAIFSIVNAFFYRPLSVPQPEQMTVLATKRLADADLFNVSYPDYVDYRDQSDAFSGMTIYTLGFLGVATPEGADRVLVSFVDTNYFDVLQLQPGAGRLLQPSDGQGEQADPVIVLGQSYWKRRFAANPAVGGQSVTVNGHAFTVVGVVPEGFTGSYFITEVDVYLPLGTLTIFDDRGTFADERNNRNFRGVGRLADGVTVEQAQASLDVIAARLAKDYPGTNKDLTVRVIPEPLARPEPDAANNLPFISSVFLALVGLVLLVACVNVANVMLARATARQKELAIRSALGAGRTRIVRQLLTESILLAGAGGLTGLLVGFWASWSLGSIRLPGDIPIRFDFSFDWRVFGFTLMVALLTGIVVGILPALRASRVNINDSLREGGRQASGSGGRHILRNSLVVAQVATSIVLLVAAGLFIRSVDEARKMDLGFNPRGLLNVSLDPGMQGYDEEQTRQFYRALVDRVRALPGIDKAALAWAYPSNYFGTSRPIHVAGKLPLPDERPPRASVNSVGEEYFATMEIPLVLGRSFTPEEIETDRGVAIINQRMAERFWPDEMPLGKRFSTEGPEGPYLSVVGVVKDGRYHQTILDEPYPYFFLPSSQQPYPERVLQVRYRGNLASTLSTVRQEIRQLDSSLPLYDVMTQEEALEGGNGFFLYEIGAMLATIMGLLGLVLAAVGLYGVVSFSASQRTHEIGIRMALGAQTRNIFRLVVGQGMLLTVIGIGIGLTLAALLSQALATLLYGVNTLDPVTFGVVLAVLLVVAFIAAFIPARRATKVDPMVALRYE